LVPAGESAFFPSIDGELAAQASKLTTFAFARKVLRHEAPDGVPALSSGGGSAVFKHGDRTIKIKRCGHSERGFVLEPFKAYSSMHDGTDLVETSEQVYGGLMGLADAVTECRLMTEFRLPGLGKAYEPLGVLVITKLPDTPFPDLPFGAVLASITSDLRTDELMYMALSPVFAELFAEKKMWIDHRGFYEADGVKVFDIEHKWSSVLDKVEIISKACGGVYRYIHDSGWLRGSGAAWFGNEVVDRDGSITPVDYDGGASLAERLSPSMRHRFQRLEVMKYLTEGFNYLAIMRPNLFVFFATAFVDAFQRGYDSASKPSLDPELIRTIIDTHLPLWPTLHSGFGFPPE
jgi:hypothetical protein